MGSYELSEELHTPPARHHLAHPWAVPEVTQDDFALYDPTKTRVTRSKHGFDRNWKVRNEILQIELVYQSWPCAMRAANLLRSGRVPVFGLLGAQHI